VQFTIQIIYVLIVIFEFGRHEVETMRRGFYFLWVKNFKT